jgi:hypothetical protein
MPLITFALPFDPNGDVDLDHCGMCGTGTNLLVYVRLDQLLIGICHDCITALEKGYQHMLEQRIRISELRK